MKKNILYILTLVTVVLSACDAIEDRQSLAPARDAGELKQSISVEVVGNTVTCSTSIKDLTVAWSSSNGWTSSGTSGTFDAPLKGDYTLTTYFLGGDERVEVTTDFNIPADDPEFFAHPYWALIAQHDGAREKTWVWADDNDYAGGNVWGNGGWRASRKGEWWTVSMDWFAENKGASPMDKLTFSMDGQLNFSTEMPGVGQPGTGSGAWIMALGGENILDDADGAEWSQGSIKLTGHSIPCGIIGSDVIQYEFWIVKLTEDEMVLCAPEGGAGADPWSGAWFFHYKREGYEYP
ncbi:hypothetical protein KEM09_11090 [Carboxylicivirga mesophila]|uniref:Uncharacterized protein n=1 Tax=Carboxylicivirga mesophila TaxID=1166478 RepID=A0ABS5KC84_9BACT|nr:hypothetical protein [Carboxylicivirga mesophila]MBS2211953.1 hypothetical protein [Carboxylicivirga mesophila]